MTNVFFILQDGVQPSIIQAFNFEKNQYNKMLE